MFHPKHYRSFQSRSLDWY